MTDDTHAATDHRDVILIDGQGVTVLLPVVQLPPEPILTFDRIYIAPDNFCMAR